MKIVGGLVTAMVLLWLLSPTPDRRQPRLGEVSRWTYQLQNVASALDRLASSYSDMLVIDYAVERGDGLKPLPSGNVARARMIAFVKDLASAARDRDPGFLIMVQNAEELLEDDDYRAAIDSVAEEDLLYGVEGTGKRNPDAMVDGSRKQLEFLKGEGKPIFAVEYLTRRAAVADAREELRSLGYVGVFPSRALDGSDPILKERAKDVPTATEAGEPETGTPEYAKAKCDGVWQRAEQKPDVTPEAQPPSAAVK